MPGNTQLSMFTLAMFVCMCRLFVFAERKSQQKYLGVECLQFVLFVMI